MKVFVVLAAVACVASAGLIAAPTTLVRAPSFDSAVIKSDRIGGNFAYSTAESHAYAAVSPVIQHVATPVAVSYSAPAIYQAPTFAYAAPAVVAGPSVFAAHSPFVVASAPAVVAAEVAPVAAPVAAPAEDATPAESAPAPAEAAPVAPAEPAPEAPASDDTVSVEAA